MPWPLVILHSLSSLIITVCLAFVFKISVSHSIVWVSLLILVLNYKYFVSICPMSRTHTGEIMRCLWVFKVITCACSSIITVSSLSFSFVLSSTLMRLTIWLISTFTHSVFSCLSTASSLSTSELIFNPSFVQIVFINGSVLSLTHRPTFLCSINLDSISKALKAVIYSSLTLWLLCRSIINFIFTTLKKLDGSNSGSNY